MPDSTRTRLRTLLVSRYTYLRRRLESIVGSKEGAADALQETWVRLDAMSESMPVGNADAYLLRMAANVAIDQHRRDRRHLSEGEVDALFEVSDEMADPERIVSARREVDELEQVLLELPARRREILLAARVDGQLNREIADHFGISQSLVEKELRHALRYCRERMGELYGAYEAGMAGRRKY